VSLFHAFTHYHKSLPLACNKQRTIEQAETMAERWLTHPNDEKLAACIDALPQQTKQLKAMLVLAQMGELTLYPIFGVTDALGTVMRRKLKPLTDPLQVYIKDLMG
jgi:hypothetical protein